MRSKAMRSKMLRQCLIGAAIATLLQCSFANQAASQPPERKPASKDFLFTQLDFPGADRTFASGINAAGHIVGWYRDSARAIHGFIYRDGEFTSVDYPGAALTQLRGIGPGGEIVGNYRLPGEPAVNAHGFRLTKSGDLIPADYPGHTNTFAQRILPNGTILGCYHDDDRMDTMRGVTMASTGFSEISAFASMNSGGTPDGSKVVGLFWDMDMNTSRAYVIENGVFTPFDAPNSTFTDAWDISPSGAIVGSFDDTSFNTHGYVLEDSKWTVLDYPGAVVTVAFGVNAGRAVVGWFIDANGQLHGFVARRARAHLEP